MDFYGKIFIRAYARIKGKVEVTAKLVNRLKVYSGDITDFSDIQKVAAELNKEINAEICQATGKPPIELLKVEMPYLLKTDLNILTGYFDKPITRRVSRESLIAFEGRKYSVPPKYIGLISTCKSDNRNYFVLKSH